MKSYHLSCIASQVLPSKNRPKRWNEKMEKELKVQRWGEGGTRNSPCLPSSFCMPHPIFALASGCWAVGMQKEDRTSVV